MTTQNEFTCDACGESFEKAWSDEKAIAESKKAFPDDDYTDMAVVCDDCWHKMGFAP